MADQRDVIAEVRRRVLTYNWLVLVVGAIILFFSANRSDGEMLTTSLEVVGTALASAAIVSFIFGQITIRDTTLQVRQAVDDALREVLEPVRENLFAGALARYRWDCHLDGLRPDGFAVQAMRVSYQTTNLPKELRLICVSSLTDEPFSAFTDDPRYIFRWQVDAGLNPSDPRCFRIDCLKVDGEELPLAAPRQTVIRESPAVEYRFPLLDSQRHHGTHSIEFYVAAQKYLGTDREIRVQAYTFRSILDAEYRLTVGAGIGSEIINTQTAGISRIGAGGLTQHGRTHPATFRQAAAYAIFTTPLQSGSSVVFTIDRGNPRTSP